ncbi:hypothetical protein [Neobacillus cucumis]|uniref:hypothetical protein n=1 Tax=Neobacillus cucumis TaxID=1740721 RepID=UPI00285317CA|nr:hypothetical protein [Neobacillus cucumis]MDR4946469.1 hypothetical protein [Neobacillus cucumis]
MPQALTSGLVLNNDGSSRFLHIDVANVGDECRTLTLEVIDWGNSFFDSPTGPVGFLLNPVKDEYPPNTAKEFNVIVPYPTHYEVRLIASDHDEIDEDIVITSAVAVAAATGWEEGYTQFTKLYKKIQVKKLK